MKDQPRDIFVLARRFIPSRSLGPLPLKGPELSLAFSRVGCLGEVRFSPVWSSFIRQHRLNLWKIEITFALKPYIKLRCIMFCTKKRMYQLIAICCWCHFRKYCRQFMQQRGLITITEMAVFCSASTYYSRASPHTEKPLFCNQERITVFQTVFH